MLLIDVGHVGHIGLRSLTDGHLEYFKTLNDAKVALIRFIKCNASTTRINKEKNFKIKFQVILVSISSFSVGGNAHRILLRNEPIFTKYQENTHNEGKQIWHFSYLIIFPVLGRWYLKP